MTILLMEGFDLYNGADATTGIAANWLLDNYYATLSTPAGRFGGKCFCTVWGGSVQYSLAYRTSRLRHRPSVLVWRSGSPISRNRRSCGCSARREPIRPASAPTASATACRASSRTSQTDLGKTSAPVLRRNAWHYVEVEGVIGDTGAMRIYVDGAKVLDLPGLIPSSKRPARSG
jgi:hypothetical protein